MPRTASRLIAVVLIALTVFTHPARSQWSEVSDVDLSKFKPADFTDD
jgi:hypothetical protein